MPRRYDRSDSETSESSYEDENSTDDVRLTHEVEDAENLRKSGRERKVVVDLNDVDLEYIEMAEIPDLHAPPSTQSKRVHKQRSRWEVLRNNMKRYADMLGRESHYLKSYTQVAEETKEAFAYAEVDDCERRIATAKNGIVQTFKRIEDENSGDTRWPELAADADDDLVDVSNVNCSRCGLEDFEGNDILFCDHLVSFECGECGYD